MYWILIAALSTGVLDGPATDDRLPVTSTAREIRLLSPDKAALGYPVRLEAVITYVDSGGTIFIQDPTGGTFFQGLRAHPDWIPGCTVVVQGKTFSGLYVPGIKATKVQTLGRGEFPAPIQITADDLTSGRFHYQWVELEGIGRSVTVTGEDTSVLRLASGSRVLEVRIDESPPNHTELVDARLRVCGLAAGYINDRRQLVFPYLKTMGYQAIAVIEPPADPSQMPVVSVDEQLRFTANGLTGRRVKVRGVVISHQPGGPIFLREGTRGLMIESKQADALKPGDVTEALGFPEMGAFRAYLADASIRLVGKDGSPKARRVTAEELLTGSHDADLVELDGRLAASFTGTSGVVLTIQHDETVFRVRCPSGPAPQWPTGSQLSVRGICHIADTTDQGFRIKPVSFELWARSPVDIRLLSSPPWWTQERLTVAVGALAFATLAALVWVLLLRQRVREQSAIIGSQMAREIVLEERHRIAREVHDTLEQELVGLVLRLDAATASADGRLLTMLDATRRLVARMHGEIRDLVWNLREQEDGPRDLGQSLARSTRELEQTATARLDLIVTGPTWSLPGPLEHNLLRIAQEAVTNALKHADPRAVEITLTYDLDHLSVRIRDDGHGFETEGAAATRPGHFGLIGMRERARKMGAQLHLASGPGQGTTIEVVVPRALANLRGKI